MEDGVLIEKGTPEHLAATELALEDTIASLTRDGARVAFIHVLPPGNSVDCLTDRALEECARPITEGSGEEPYNGLFSKLANDVDNVSAISLQDVICPDGVCPLMIDGMVTRYDGGHLTGTFSRWLAPVLAQRLGSDGVDLSRLGSS